MKSLILTLLLAFLIFNSISAQNVSEDYLGAWYYISINHRFSERFSLTPYAEFRFYETSSNYNLSFLSLNANYHFKNAGYVSLSYANLDIDRVFEFDDSPHIQENRIMETYSYSHQLKKLKIGHRLRLEHRFLQLSSGHIQQDRLRYRLALSYPLNDFVYLALTEEGFLNFQNDAFHENRFFIGFGFNVLQKTQLQVGYLKHHINRNNLNRIMVGLIYKSDGRKKKL